MEQKSLIQEESLAGVIDMIKNLIAQLDDKRRALFGEKLLWKRAVI